MRAPPVVMALVLGQDRPQVPFVEDEHLVGDLGTGGEHEPFRVSVRARAARRDLHGLDAGVGQDWIEAEDSGGPWRRRLPDGRPHGLDVVEALTGPDGWGAEITTGGSRVVWARLDLDAAGE